jgi:hypothetical protein
MLDTLPSGGENAVTGSQAAAPVRCARCERAIDTGTEPYVLLDDGPTCEGCYRAGRPPAGTDPFAELLAGDPPSLVRLYRGSQQPDAVAEFEKEASSLATRGYLPSTQSWATGQWGVGAWLIAVLACLLIALAIWLLVVAVFVFAFMLIVRPDGSLTVTYVRQTQQASAVPPPGAGNQSLSDRLTELDAARAAGLVSPEEHAEKRAAILAAF